LIASSSHQPSSTLSPILVDTDPGRPLPFSSTKGLFNESNVALDTFPSSSDTSKDIVFASSIESRLKLLALFRRYRRKKNVRRATIMAAPSTAPINIAALTPVGMSLEGMGVSVLVRLDVGVVVVWEVGVETEVANVDD
jgi:hypothetical protein